MTEPPAMALLNVWERAAALPPARRALYLAELEADAVLGAAPVLLRDRHLATLRLRWFGRRLDLLASCPACEAAFDIELDVGTLIKPAPPASAPILIEDGEASCTLRQPTADDLIALGSADGTDAEATLIARCLTHEEGTQPLSRRLCDRVADGLAELARGAGQAIDFTCGLCGHRWTDYLDIGFVVWREIDRAARTLAGEVTRIATVCHWSEEAILALGPGRRRLYLDAIA